MYSKISYYDQIFAEAAGSEEEQSEGSSEAAGSEEEQSEGSSEAAGSEEEQSEGSSEAAGSEKEQSEGSSETTGFEELLGDSVVSDSLSGNGVMVTIDPACIYDFGGIETLLAEISERQEHILEQEEQIYEAHSFLEKSSERQELQLEACVSVLLLFCVALILLHVYKFFCMFF